METGVSLTLTPRQQEMVVYAARGETNGEMATRFGISEKTVKKHFTDIYQRTEAKKRANLVALAIVERWIDPGTLF